MLDAFIIEELRRREREERFNIEQPRLELPIDVEIDYGRHDPENDRRKEEKRPNEERGVIIIEI